MGAGMIEPMPRDPWMNATPFREVAAPGGSTSQATVVSGTFSNSPTARFPTLDHVFLIGGAKLCYLFGALVV